MGKRVTVIRRESGSEWWTARGEDGRYIASAQSAEHAAVQAALRGYLCDENTETVDEARPRPPKVGPDKITQR